MTDTFDLRPTIRFMLTQWRWVVATALLATLVAVIIVLFQPRRYEATALVAVTQPLQDVQFDPRIEADDRQDYLASLPELAGSDELLQQLLDEGDWDGTTINSIADLRRQLHIESSANNTLLRLIVTNENPEQAAHVANLWARLLVEWSHGLFGAGGQQLLFFESQLLINQQEVAQVDAELIAFQATNRSALLAGEIEALLLGQSETLLELQQIDGLMRDIDGLLQRTHQEAGAPSYADQVTALLLQLSSLELTTEQIQLQLGAEAPGDIASPAAFDAFLMELNSSLLAKRQLLEQDLQRLEPLLLGKQRELQQLTAEHERLTNQRSIVIEATTALARKVEEEKISAQEANSGIRMASHASVPDEPAGTRRLVILLITVLVATSLSLLALLLWFWWQDEPSAQ